MKKLFTLFLTLFVASSVWAYDFENSGIYYSIVTGTENTVAVTYKDNNYNSYSGSIAIPSSVKNNGITYSVTSIGGYAFYRCTGLTSITIPNSVTTIGNNAFFCKSLTSVTIPNSVTSIEEYAFSGCGLTSVSISNSVTTIGNNVFKGCTSLTSVTIPNSVRSIGACAFEGCTSLTSVTISNSVRSIENYAFEGCTSLTSVTIPNSVRSIGAYAFYGCTSLTSVTIPSSVQGIGAYAFGETTLKSMTNNSELEVDFGFIKDGIRYQIDRREATVTDLFEGKYSGDVIIPDYVKFCGKTYYVSSIYDGAFLDCSELTSVTTSIAHSNFKGCTNLKKLTFLRKPFYYTTFEGINTEDIYLYVPCEYYEEYTSSEYDFTLDFEHIECIGSEKVELQKDEVIVEPEKTEAVFTMPINESANSYTLTIQNNGFTFYTFTFNAQGQLSNIDLLPDADDFFEFKSSILGYQFTVTGLLEALDYGYSFKALASNKSVLKEYTGSFTTKNEDGTGGSSQGGKKVGGGSGEGGLTAINGVSNTTTVAIVGNQIFVNGEAPAFVVTVSGKKIANQNLKAGVYFVEVDGEMVKVAVK